MNKMFMVDLETTGTVVYPSKSGRKEDPPAKILQIAFLEMKWDPSIRLWEPGKDMTWLAHHPMPERLNPFQEKYQKGLFEACDKHGSDHTPDKVRKFILEYFERCGANGPKETILCGYNASNFDVPLLTRDEYLYSPYTNNETDELEGDFHYRIYEIGGAVQFYLNVCNYPDRKTALMDAEEHGWHLMEDNFSIGKNSKFLEGRGDHDALYDCYSQTALLNGMIRRGGEGDWPI